MTPGSGRVGDTVEADETYIGGKGRFMHAPKRKRLIMKSGRSIAGKVAVMVLLDRHGKDGVSQARTEVLTSMSKAHIQGNASKYVAAGASVYTDAPSW